MPELRVEAITAGSPFIAVEGSGPAWGAGYNIVIHRAQGRLMIGQWSAPGDCGESVSGRDADDLGRAGQLGRKGVLPRFLMRGSRRDFAVP